MEIGEGVHSCINGRAPRMPAAPESAARPRTESGGDRSSRLPNVRGSRAAVPSHQVGGDSFQKPQETNRLPSLDPGFWLGVLRLPNVPTSAAGPRSVPSGLCDALCGAGGRTLAAWGSSGRRGASRLSSEEGSDSSWLFLATAGPEVVWPPP